MDQERRHDYPQILSDIEVIKEMVTENKADVKDVKKILNGNGQPGIVAKVSRHEDFINEIRYNHADIKRTIYQAILALVLTGIGIIMGIRM